MAKGMSDSDISDDDSCPSIHELLDHVRIQEGAITKKISKNKGLKDKLASSSSNYIELDKTLDMIIDQNDELTKKNELLEQTKLPLKRHQNQYLNLKRMALFLVLI
jgi:hypothetical protein